MLFELNWSLKFVLAYFVLLPVWAAGSCRLEDTGENGNDVFLPAFLIFIPVAFIFPLVVFTLLGTTIGQHVVTPK